MYLTGLARFKAIRPQDLPVTNYSAVTPAGAIIERLSEPGGIDSALPLSARQQLRNAVFQLSQDENLAAPVPTGRQSRRPRPDPHGAVHLLPYPSEHDPARFMLEFPPTPDGQELYRWVWLFGANGNMTVAQLFTKLRSYWTFSLSKPQMLSTDYWADCSEGEHRLQRFNRSSP